MAENRKLQILITAKDQASQTMKGIEGTLKNLEAPFKKISQVGAVGFTALSAGIGKTVKDAAEFQSVAMSFERLSKDLGASGDEMLAKLNEVSKGTIANKDIMLSVNKAVALGVGNNMEDLAKLMEIARVKGSALGLDTTQAFNDMVTGIGRGSPMILDNLGIITKGWAEEASALGVAMDAQFIMNKIINDGSVELANMGEVLLTPQERLQQMSKQFKDLSAGIGEVFLPIIQDVLNAVLPIIQRFSEWVKNNQELVKNIVLITGAVLGFMAVAYPLIKVIQIATTVFKALQVVALLFNTTLWANPITWVIAGIVALIAIIWLLWNNWEQISNWLAEKMEWIRLKFDEALNWVAQKVQWVSDTIMSIWETITNWISSKIDILKNAFGTLRDWVVSIFNTIGESIKGAFKATVNFVIDKINWLIKQANKISSALSVVPGINIPSIPEIPKLAKGGVVNRPTLAMIGEAGPEAVVPLNKRNNPMYGQGGLTIIVNGDVSGEELIEKVGEGIMNKLRMNTQGALSF